VRVNLQAMAITLLGPVFSPAAQPNQPAKHAFESYVAHLEARLARQHANSDTFTAALSPDGRLRTDTERELIRGAIRIERVNGGSWPVDGGLLHHSRAAAFVPGVSPKDMLTLLNDYDHLGQHYSPEVVSSHVLANNGTMVTLAMRLKKQQVITVVLDAEFQIESRLVGSDSGYSFSRQHPHLANRPARYGE
jgi:hypothetical protein